MTDEKIRSKKKPGRAYKVLNLTEPQLFDRMMATAAKRKIGHKTLSGVARYAMEQWIAGN